jgi:hypothetical protein
MAPLSQDRAPGSQNRRYHMMSSKPGDGIGRTTSDGIIATHGVIRRRRHTGAVAGARSRRTQAALCPLRQTRAALCQVAPSLQPHSPKNHGTEHLPGSAAQAVAIRSTCPFGFPFPRTPSGTVAHASGQLVSSHHGYPSGVIRRGLPLGLISPSRVPAFSPVCGKVHEPGYNIVSGANQQRDASGYSRIGCFFICNFPVSCHVLKSCTQTIRVIRKTPIDTREIRTYCLLVTTSLTGGNTGWAE